MNSLEIRTPDDFHVHLRQGPAMAAYAARAARHFGRFLAMPNVVPPLTGPAALADYRRAVAAAIAASGYASTPLSCFKLVPGMGREAVLACAAAGAVAGKYYPAGSTTNASDGVPEPAAVADELAAMQDAGLVLSIHGEDPSASALDRERAFLGVVDGIVGSYPRLRVALEHLSCAESVRAVLAWPERVGATITAHHLSYTIDDLLGGGLRPELFCKPVLKSAADRAALLEAAVSGSPRFFFGSDSAPHPPEAKAAGAAGCYTAPVALSLLAAAFEEAGALDRLETFVSVSGARFYGLGLNPGVVRLSREGWTVPAAVDGAVTPAAGRTLAWTADRI